MKKRIHIFIFAIAMLLLTLKTDVYAESISISQSKATMNVGEQIDLDITGTDKTVKWLSYNENTVFVDENGIITALRTGKTTIRARVGFWYKTCSVNVVKPSIKVNKTNATIYHGGTSTNTVQLKATVKGASKNVTWTSSDESVAIVDKNGKITSVSEGTAIITVSANTVSASCKVTVKENNISLNLKEMQLSTKGTGSSIKLIPAITGSKKNVKWTTSDKSVATVSGGKVTGKNTGTAIITATANGVSTSCNVTVVKGLISINEENITLYTGETKQLKSNAGKNDIVNWKSSKEDVVSVENGKLTAKQAGEAIISIESDGMTDSCKVTVKDTVTSISENEISLKTKGIDKTYTLNYDVIGRKTNVKWTSSNNKIATVSKGKITAKKEGTVTITATANGMSDKVTVTVSAYEPKISLNQSAYTLYTKKGNTVTLKAIVDGASKKVTYTSSNPDCATVTSKGKVTAHNAGESIITATANGVSAQCVITVKETSVILENENLLMKKGDVENIGVDVIGSSQSIKWSTSNKKVATVKNGKITAKANGEADIIVTANGVKSVCHVMVAEKEHEHSYESIVTAPTCTEDGYTTHTCECGETYVDTPVTALGHIWGEWQVTKEATETEEGSRKRICSVCNEEETEAIPVIGHEHVYESVVTEPTCTEEGYTTHTCRCEDSYVDTPIPALGHAWGEWIITKEATETEEGLQIRTCNVCSEEETETIPVVVHVHSYESIVTAPTCTEDGYTTHTCKCGETYTDTPVTALGHTWGEWQITKEATETEEGLEKRICNVCNEEETKAIPIVEHIHSYESVVTEPTCTAQGYTTYTCACGDSYISDYVNTINHTYNWDDEIVVKEATCIETGIIKWLCTVCSYEYILSGSEGNHSYEEVITKKPTCTENGLLETKCKYCGIVTDSETIEASHIWGEWTITKDPGTAAHITIDEFGERTTTCTVCGERKTETIINIDASDYDENDITFARKECLNFIDETVVQICGQFDEKMSYETFELTNELRGSLGLELLEWEELYEYIGKIRSAELGIKYSHERPNGKKPAYTNSVGMDIGLGENISITNYTAIDVFNGWCNSEGHYANIVNPDINKYYASCFKTEKGYAWVQLFR